jgi:hypothetical protein
MLDSEHAARIEKEEAVRYQAKKSLVANDIADVAMIAGSFYLLISAIAWVFLILRGIVYWSIDKAIPSEESERVVAEPVNVEEDLFRGTEHLR